MKIFCWNCHGVERLENKKALMDDFNEVVNELSLIDLKTSNGWFTWVNNREGDALVKERLDHFIISANDVHKFPFIETKVIRQVNWDHDAILLDMEGCKLKVELRDHRFRFRVNSWSKRLLSYGGKEVLLKAIIQSIPTYTFSVFLAPKGIIEELHSITSQVWWTSNEKSRSWAMMAWKQLCYPKGIGSMGFMDIYMFNLALLGRQVWRLANFKDTLCFRVLSAKYFPERDVFNAKR
ncbi:hypothetical protein J1N35_000639 [Gossypium stocksii]|uniref:Endonuclease/exonuclease/phosphatase domain-containing protein n=1 Tax=Gossypium stocksii TaxID=47602 RepID=A0A9D3WIR2_9ROSI|nr:hypothetical protein J1N35_000639 [Gossypium stocksii]